MKHVLAAAALASAAFIAACGTQTGSAASSAQNSPPSPAPSQAQKSAQASATPSASPAPHFTRRERQVIRAVNNLNSGDFATIQDTTVVTLAHDLCRARAAGASENTVGTAFQAQVPMQVSPAQTAKAVEKALCPRYYIAPMTIAQRQALASAESYLGMGSGFSKAGLYQQLHSSAGEGFSASLARFAVDHVKVNWDHQAVLSARGYMSMQPGWSCASLVQQLSSSYGEGFTLSQAQYAARVVGVC